MCPIPPHHCTKLETRIRLTIIYAVSSTSPPSIPPFREQLGTFMICTMLRVSGNPAKYSHVHQEVKYHADPTPLAQCLHMKGLKTYLGMKRITC